MRQLLDLMEMDCSSLTCSIAKILNNNYFSLLKVLHSTADVQLFHQKSPLCLTVSASVAEDTISCGILSFVLLLIELDILKEDRCVRWAQDAG